jgi:hypothetical protein
VLNLGFQDMYRRIRILDADAKADPNVVETVKRNRDQMEVGTTLTYHPDNDIKSQSLHTFHIFITLR